MMDTGLLSRIRNSLGAKRDSLTDWSRSAGSDELARALGPAGRAPFERHLMVLDVSMEEAEEESLGLCTVCHEPVEPRLIQVDYTRSVCIEHFSDEERRQLETELELAGAVQRSLLPQHPPDTPQLEIAAFSRPAQIVTGDYFDFFPFRRGRQGLVVADVAGHGLSSSLIMASLQSMLRTLAQEHHSPAELVAQVNRLCLHNIQFTTFISLFLGAFDADSHEFTFCNAGHNPALLLRDSGTVEWLRATGAAVGLTEEATYADQTIALQPADLLFLYTDGLTETADPGGHLFGVDRMVSLLSANNPLPAQELLQVVRRELDAFAGAAPPADDLTMVGIRVLA